MTDAKSLLTVEGFSKDLNFDLLLREELGIYVYALIDPRPEHKGVFYIGKAGGGGEGNVRIKQHFEEAMSSVKESDSSSLPPKIKRFWDIWMDGHQVDWCIIRRKIASEGEAFALEGSLIDAFAKANGHTLTNRQSGHNAKDNGFLSKEEALRLKAPPFEPSLVPETAVGRNIFLFNIKNTLKGVYNPNDADIFQATHGAWAVGQKWLSVSGSIAVGLIDGISVGVYGIDKWHLKEGDEDKSKRNQRWKFSKSSVDDDVKDTLHRKSFSDLISSAGNWGRGGRVICTITQTRSLEILCGKRKVQ